MRLRVLALEPYFGGSHQAFLEGWVARSLHAWTLLTLPARHWKWRMRHAPITLARRVAEHFRSHGTSGWDLVFCSDMLGLAEFRGLAPREVATLPAVAYFHENQWTYPDPRATERDRHFAFTNLTTALAANQVWFNSAFNRDELLSAAADWLRRMPDFPERQVIDQIRGKSRIEPLGVERRPAGRSPARTPGPLHVAWAARWEHDKDPATWFEALRLLAERKVDYRVSVLGQSFREVPPEFTDARNRLRPRIVRWGYEPSRDGYLAALREADVFVSTARHEFFGLAVVEAVLAGAYPLVPRRLVYPELLGLDEHPEVERHFYEGTAEDLAAKLTELAGAVRRGEPLEVAPSVRRRLDRFDWTTRAAELDDRLRRLIPGQGGPA